MYHVHPQHFEETFLLLEAKEMSYDASTHTAYFQNGSSITITQEGRLDDGGVVLNAHNLESFVESNPEGLSNIHGNVNISQHAHVNIGVGNDRSN